MKPGTGFLRCYCPVRFWNSSASNHLSPMRKLTQEESKGVGTLMRKTCQNMAKWRINKRPPPPDCCWFAFPNTGKCLGLMYEIHQSNDWELAAVSRVWSERPWGGTRDHLPPCPVDSLLTWSQSQGVMELEKVINPALQRGQEQLY